MSGDSLALLAIIFFVETKDLKLFLIFFLYLFILIYYCSRIQTVFNVFFILNYNDLSDTLQLKSYQLSNLIDLVNIWLLVIVVVQWSYLKGLTQKRLEFCLNI